MVKKNNKKKDTKAAVATEAAIYININTTREIVYLVN